MDFRESRWFTRGWTLQELLAPCVQLRFTPGNASDLVKKAHSDNNPRDNRYPPVTPELREEIKGSKGLFPAELRAEIEVMNGWVYLTVNMGSTNWIRHFSKSVRRKRIPALHVSGSLERASRTTRTSSVSFRGTYHRSGCQIVSYDCAV